MQPYSGKTNGVSWETTFSTDVKFKCQHCGYCCINSNVILFDKDIEQIKESGIKDFVEPSHRGFRIIGSDKKECMFHKNKCRIYKIRPIVCREYPFKVTFYSKNKAYVDLIYSCPAIMKREFEKQNNVDFYKLVENRVVNSTIIFELDKKIKTIEKQIDKKQWRKKIKKLTQMNDLIDLSNNKLKFVNKINLKVKRKNMDEKAKKVFMDYLLNFFDRKTTILDFYMGYSYLNKRKIKISVKELQNELGKRIILPLQFFALQISKGKTITEKDAKQTIFTLDCSLFTPMGSIVPGVLKKTKFFK